MNVDHFLFRLAGWLGKQPERIQVGLMIIPILGGAVLVPLGMKHGWTQYITLLGYGFISLFVGLFVAMAIIFNRKTEILARYGADGVKLSGLAWHDFERFMHYLMELQGYRVERRGGAEADGGVDLIGFKDGVKTIIQCKQWRWEPIGVNIVRELLGSVECEQAQAGIVVTTGIFSDPAEELVNRLKKQNSGRRIELIDGNMICRILQEHHEKDPDAAISRRHLSGITEAILQAIAQEDNVIHVPRCQTCNEAMRLAYNPKNGDYFWGCPTWKVLRDQTHKAKRLSEAERLALTSELKR